MREKMKKIFKKLPCGFSIQSYKLIFIFLFPIFGVVYNRIRDKNAIVKNEFFYIQLYFISYLFSFIPLLIYFCKYRTREDKSNKENSIERNTEFVNEDNNSNILILQQENHKRKKHLLLGILIIILLCIDSVGYNYLDYQGLWDKGSVGLAFKIPILFLLSYFILKYRFYRHHYITILLNLIALLSKYTLTIVQSNSQEYVPLHLLLYLFFALSHSLLLVPGKYFMEKYGKTPYFLMLIIGVINCLIIISIACIKYLIDSESDIFYGFNNYINSFTSFLLFMGDIISQFLYNLGAWITIYYFSPLHIIICENVIEIYYYLYDIKENLEIWNEMGFYLNIWFMPTVLFFNLICSLIFNEIIILKCFKLDYYTRIRIEEREKNDFENFLNMDENSTSENNETFPIAE